MKRLIPLTTAVALLLTSCGENPAPPTPSPTKPEQEKPAPAKASLPRAYFPSNSKSYSIPTGTELITHWDEIHRQIMSQPPGNIRDYRLGGAISSLASADPFLAATALAEWKHAIPSEWADAAQTVVVRMWEKDPAAALDYVLNTLPEKTRALIWPKLLAQLPSPDAATLLGNLPPTPASLKAAANVLDRWAERDPAAAAKWLDGYAATLTPGQLALLQNPGYTYRDTRDAKEKIPDAWRRAFEAATLPAAKRLFGEKYLRQTDREDPDKLAETTAAVEKSLGTAHAAELRLDTARFQMIQDPIRYFAELTPEEIQTLPDRFLSEALHQLADQDSPAAARQAVALDRPDDVKFCVSQWFNLSPADATAFALNLAPGPAREKSLAELCARHAWNQNFAAADKCRAEITDPQLARQADSGLKSGRDRHAGNAQAK